MVIHHITQVVDWKHWVQYDQVSEYDKEFHFTITAIIVTDDDYQSIIFFFLSFIQNRQKDHTTINVIKFNCLKKFKQL